MELGSILRFLENRSILVTGGTGFLGKILIEKILRVQPNVNKLYLLLRASDMNSAMHRFNNEIVEKELFKVLKEKQGGNFRSLISEKVKVVAGDITCDDLDIKDSDLLQTMWKEVDVVINLAATTNFDERYDVSLGVNTLGAKHVLNFAEKCEKLKVLVHVSTAYVSGEKEGLILETPCKMGETLNGASGLDIETEKNFVDETLKQLRAKNHSEDFIKSAMKDLGIKRAKKYGWPNTYVFTKAMGEMLLGHLRGNTPLVIIRPTMVISTYQEPFPGWIEGMRTIDSLGLGYGKGRIKCFLGDPKSIIDVIPADIVVNAIIVAMTAHAYQPNESIYHISSSVSNPLESTWLQDYAYQYFTKHPWIDKKGKPVIVGKVTVLPTMDSFRRYMAINYFLPLKALKIANIVFCQYFKDLYLNLSGKVRYVMRLIELYEPYLFFKGYYDNMNAEKLRMALKVESEAEAEMFNFDPKSFNWEDYFMNVHIPGVVKRVFR